jgi:hypothetical protein
MKCIVIASAVALLVLANEAQAIQCNELTGSQFGTLVYARVPDTQVNVVKAMARALRDNSPQRVTLVWQDSSSCSNREALATGATSDGVFNYVPSASEDSAWTPASAPLSCDVATGLVPSVYAYALDDACEGSALPTDIATERGAVVPYVFAVPNGSDETAITAEEAYFVFGFGADGQVTPWNDEAEVFVRTSTKDIMAVLGEVIRVPKTRWHGQAYDGSSAVVAALQGTGNPPQAIGILDAAVLAGTRATIKPLAFRAFQQRKAYYPSATRDGLDLRNVRDGHYVPWSVVTWAYRNGAVAQLVVEAFAAKTGAYNFDPLQRAFTPGTVPWCAMEVTRNDDGGLLSRTDVSPSCTCAFDALIGTTSCATCSPTSVCATGVCRRGYCEAR